MDTTRKRINLGATTNVDTEVIFNRTLGILGSGELDLHDLFSLGLAPIPHHCASKSKRKNYLQVEESSRTVEISDLIVFHSCAVLWTIIWPISGTVLDPVNSVAAYVHARLMNSDVHLIFNRYLDYSTKGRTRGRIASLLLTAVIILFCNPRSHHSLCLLLSVTTKCS